ncbi:MAG TPA: ATP-binding protein [Candidatus Baltobacteraceae bacterium]
MLRRATRQPSSRPREVGPVLEGPPLLDCDIELAALQSLLSSPTPCVVMVCGPNGCGKTALVRRVPDALYVDAAGLSVASVLQRIYGLAFVNDPTSVPTAEQLASLLAKNPVPIIIDDFTRSLDDLRSLVETISAVSVVYTSVDPVLISPSVAELRLTGLREGAARELFERVQGAPIADGDPILAVLVGTFEGNPLLISQAAALARADKVVGVQNVPALAASIFNAMTIGEQQIFATIAAFNGARPDRATVEAVSGVANASGVINALVARSAIESDGARFWISPLMYSTTAVAPSLMHYDALFDFIEKMLAQDPVPADVLANPGPYLVGMRIALTKGRHPAVMEYARKLSDALLLSGDVAGAREAAELVREAANELRDQTMQGWAAHQLGTFSAFTGDRADAVSWLETAVTRRERLGDQAGKEYSLENLAIVCGEPSPKKRRGKKGFTFGRDLVLLAVVVVAAMAAAAVAYLLLRHQQEIARERPHHVAHHPARVVAMQHPTAAVQTSALAVPPKVQSVSTSSPVPTRASKPAEPRPTKPRPTKLRSTKPRPAAHAAPSPALQPKPRVVAVQPAAPRIVRFTASKATLVAGQRTSLCYDVRDAAHAAIDGIGTLAGSAGCVGVNPHRSTRYVLTALGHGERTVASAAISVVRAPSRRAPRILRFTTNTGSVVDGDYAQLCFSLVGATSVVIEPVGPQPSARSGCVSVSPRINTYYRLYARNSVGIVSRSVHVAVVPNDLLNH